MKFYKIVDPEGHNGLVYHEGLNTDPKPFNPSGNCEPGGIYFAREHIFAFLSYGTELYEVEPVGDEVYENPGYPKKWKAKQLNMKYIGKLVDNIPFLIEQGADIHVRNDEALRWAAKKCHFEVLKYLVEQGADIHSDDDYALRWAVHYGHLDIVKYLVEQGADIHAKDDCALRWAVHYGHLELVKYLVENGANIHVDDESALRYAASRGHLAIVKYLVEQGADIHARDDGALRWTASCNLNIIKYLVKQGAKISVIRSKKLRLQCHIYRAFDIWIGKK